MESYKHAMYRLPELTIAILLLCFSVTAISPICSRDLQCDDENLDTFDICFTPLSRCVNIGKDSASNQGPAPTTLSSIINDANVSPLSVAEKRDIISTAATFMRELNVNRFLQLNVLGIDIVEELNSFSASLLSPALRYQSNFEFHGKMRQLFQKMNDLHTRYIPPDPLQSTAAILGFRVEPFFVRDMSRSGAKPKARYAVADVVTGIAPDRPAFAVGAEIVKWNGEDIASVVQKLGEDSYGSNLAAQISQGVDLLSFRLFEVDPIPDSEEVEIEYRSANGALFVTRAKWFYVDLKGSLISGGVSRALIPAIPFQERIPFYLDHLGKSISRPTGITRPSEEGTAAGLVTTTRTSINVSPQFERLFSAEIIQTKSGPIGRLALPSFDAVVTLQLQSELTRILRLMPENGLVLDARNNLGGSSTLAAFVTKLVSGKDLERIPDAIRATSLNRNLVSGLANLTKNVPEAAASLARKVGPALETAIRAGERFTGPVFDLFGEPNIDVSGVYSGPVVSLVNGRTFSAGDEFAALQVDKNTSILVGTSDNVGAGGASVLPYELLSGFLPNLFRTLPGGVSFTTSFTRVYRTGISSGAILENFGVKPEIRYYPTLNDAVNHDCDLFEFLGQILASKSGFK